MASTSTQLQDGSSLPSGSSSWKYDVFLSFRGEDTRKGFVDHLSSALLQKDIYMFKDDQKLKRGESISPALLKAIEESRFAVVIFSENYASSKWCLDELVKILECKKTRGLTVLPVFYKVDPSDLRKQRGSVGEAFAKHERDSSKEKGKEKVQRWRNALMEAANISGWDLENGTTHGLEAKLVQEIVKGILNKLEDKDLSILDYIVGLDTRVAEVKSLLGTGLDDSRIVGIFGMGGIGKTTIAKAVYNQIRFQFDASSYLENVRETFENHRMESLQELLISDILLDNDIRIRNLDRGRSMIMTRARHKKVLVVFDDVDQQKQLKELIGKLDCFGLGSRIIITTRDSHLLDILGVKHKYTVKNLNDEEALELFCFEAFMKNQPTQGYEGLTNSVVCYAGGVPLALRVLGSFLLGRKVNEWQSAIHRLRQEPNPDIQQVLKLSYDGLGREEKEIFLDIACFFKWESKDYAIDMLDACGFHADIGIRVLEDKALVKIRGNMIDMHDLIQEMGWHIVNEKSPEEPGGRSRLWKYEDIYHTLTKKTGIEAVRAIVLDSHERKGISLSPDTFSNMRKLRLLKLSNVQLPNGLDYLSNDLRILDWCGYPSKYLPSNFQPESLVKLKMSRSCLKQLWNGRMCLDKLKYVDLSYSSCITKSLDFTHVANLKELIFEGCTNLVEIDPSIEAIKGLTLLNLRDCKYLKVLPMGCWLKSLEQLVLSGCSKLKNISKVLAFTECLIKLDLERTCVKELPVEHLSNLQFIRLQDCKELTSLPSGICGLKRLARLIISGCSKLSKLPEHIGELESLQALCADFTDIRQPSSSIIHLKKLKYLSFWGCKGGVTSTLWNSLFSSFLAPKECQDPMGFELPPLSGLWSLTILDLRNCIFSEGFLPDGLGSLASLQCLYLSGSNIISLPASIRGLHKLFILQLVDCKKLKTLPYLPTNISFINASGCTSLETLSDPLPRKLAGVNLNNCHTLVKNRPRLPLELLRNYLKEGGFANSRECSIFVPGREIPKCFSHQNNVGHYLRIQLMPNWYQRLRGFFVCVVFEAKAPSKLPSTATSIYLECYGICNDVVLYATDVLIHAPQFQSGHVVLDYRALDIIMTKVDVNDLKIWTEIIFYFRTSCPEMFAPVKCAAHMVYESDEEWPNPHASIQQTDHMVYENDEEWPNPHASVQQSDCDEFESIEWIQGVVLRKRNRHDYDTGEQPNRKRLRGTAVQWKDSQSEIFETSIQNIRKLMMIQIGHTISVHLTEFHLLWARGRINDF